MNKLLAVLFSIFLCTSLCCYSQENVDNVISNYDKKLILRYAVQSNFTNSGNIEVLAFFQYRKTEFIEGEKHYAINETLCFVLDKDTRIILKVYNVPFSTNQFNKSFNLTKMDMDLLGKEVPFGRIGDFNNNGVDELYLYSLEGNGFYPAFFEFDGKQFKDILNYESDCIALNIIKIDKKDKILIFETVEENVRRIVFKWVKDVFVLQN